jgi:hypothetical protein
MRVFCSDDSTVGAQRLAINPSTVASGKEGDSGGDVFGLAAPW